jgi:hypothetical protein
MQYLPKGLSPQAGTVLLVLRQPPVPCGRSPSACGRAFTTVEVVRRALVAILVLPACLSQGLARDRDRLVPALGGGGRRQADSGRRRVTRGLVLQPRAAAVRPRRLPPQPARNVPRRARRLRPALRRVPLGSACITSPLRPASTAAAEARPGFSLASRQEADSDWNVSQWSARWPARRYQTQSAREARRLHARRDALRPTGCDRRHGGKSQGQATGHGAQHRPG